MFSLVVLFSVFLGLVGILGLYGECRRRRREHARTHDTHANLAWLQAWLDDKGHSVPSVAMVIGLLNRFAKRELQSEVRPVCMQSSFSLLSSGREGGRMGVWEGRTVYSNLSSLPPSLITLY